MIFAELIETSWFWVGVSIEESAYVVLLLLGFFDFLGFVEIGLGGALKESGWRLAGESSDVFMEDVVTLLTLELYCLPPHGLLLLFCLLCLDGISILHLFLQDSFLALQRHLAFLLLPEHLVLFPVLALLSPLVEGELKILLDLH